MYGQGYVGTSQDQQRIRRQEKQREEQKKKYEDLKGQSRDIVESAGLKQFGSSTTETLDSAFKNETVGLVTREEFIQKRTTLKQRMEDELRQKQRAADDAEFKEKERRRKEKAKLAMKSKLSFIGDDEEDEEEGAQQPEEAPAVQFPKAEPQDGKQEEEEENQVAKRPKFGKFGKDPSVATDFLPDRDREREEQELRTKLKQEWITQQEMVRAERLEVVYSYWDGQGHRRKIEVCKGDSISTFLKAARDQLATEFREMRAVSVDNLLYIKEDLILPHHHTFYDLIVNKARGKSGPLFSFTVHEDVRITNDASVEKADSHAGKVVERHWYDKNKHIFPASRWETYDPDKSYDKYTIFG